MRDKANVMYAVGWKVSAVVLMCFAYGFVVQLREAHSFSASLVSSREPIRFYLAHSMWFQAGFCLLALAMAWYAVGLFLAGQMLAKGQVEAYVFQRELERLGRPVLVGAAVLLTAGILTEPMARGFGLFEMLDAFHWKAICVVWVSAALGIAVSVFGDRWFRRIAALVTQPSHTDGSVQHHEPRSGELAPFIERYRHYTGRWELVLVLVVISLLLSVATNRH